MSRKKTTFNIDEDLVEEARDAAVYMRTTMADLMESALRLELARTKRSNKLDKFPARSRGLKGRPIR